MFKNYFSTGMGRLSVSFGEYYGLVNLKQCILQNWQANGPKVEVVPWKQRGYVYSSVAAFIFSPTSAACAKVIKDNGEKKKKRKPRCRTCSFTLKGENGLWWLFFEDPWACVLFSLSVTGERAAGMEVSWVCPWELWVRYVLCSLCYLHSAPFVCMCWTENHSWSLNMRVSSIPKGVLCSGAGRRCDSSRVRTW